MGGLAAMAWITTLSLVLHSLSYLQAQDICCKIKIVSGTLAEDQGLAGTYTLIRDAGVAPDQACANGCVYSRDGVEGDEYCFQAVAAGADIEDQECGADTGATEPAGASDGATDDIKEKLSPAATTPSRRVRQKRQDTTDGPTPMPVEVPATCNDFGDAYKELLNLAAAVNDDNIDQIKVYVDALIAVDVVALCDSDARAALATETNADADAAIEKTKEYTDATEIKVTELKQKVNEDIALQETINEELVSRDEPTVPVAASTHAIEPTTPSAEEETPEGTGPAEGETTDGTPPMQISTAKPARLLFERKRRSRGSLLYILWNIWKHHWNKSEK